MITSRNNSKFESYITQDDNYKSLLLSYSDASNKFGPLEVKKVIEKSENFKVAAVAVAAVKCPQHIVK